MKIVIGPMWEDLSMTRELRLTYMQGWEGAPEPGNAQVLLDSVPGTHTPIDGNTTSVRWDPVPPSASLLEIRYDDGDLEEIDVELLFEDAACEEANKPPYCGG